MAKHNRIHTVYDVMAENGVFSSNPANVNSFGPDHAPLYKGPVEYPKMLYHPRGEETVLVAASAEMTPFGPKMLNEQRCLTNLMVNSAEEEAKAKADGWLSHPAYSIEAGNEVRREQGLPLLPVPTISSIEHINRLENEKKKLEAELAAYKQEKLRRDKAELASQVNANVATKD